MTTLSINETDTQAFIKGSEATAKQVYTLSHAPGANSGFSVGEMQTDFSVHQDQADEVITLVKNANVLNNTEFDTFELALTRKGNAAALSPSITTKVNTVLSAALGKALVDRFDKKQIQDVLKHVRTAITAARTNPRYQTDPDFKATIDSAAFQSLVASNVNQYGQPNAMSRFLAGKPVKVGGQKISTEDFETFTVASYFAYESQYAMVADAKIGGAVIMRERRIKELQKLAEEGLLSQQEADKLKQVADQAYRPTAYKAVVGHLRANGVDLSKVSLEDDMARAYAEQGFAADAAGKAWAAQYGQGGFGAEGAKLGLTVREAQAVFGAAQGEDVTNRGYSGPIMAATQRYRSEFARTGDAAKAIETARSGLAEARTYSGPSQDLSPEDTASVAENRAQLARNTQLLEARRASLLDGGRITIDGVPMNATRTVGTSTVPATRAGAQRLYQKKAQALHPDPIAARRSVRATLPEQSSMPDFAAVFNEAVDGLQSVFGGKAHAATPEPATPARATPSRGQLESAKVAGLVMDKPMADKLMKSTAYNTKHDPMNAFATQSARSFYDATYADNDAAAPTRTSASEEPTRQKAIADAQKVTELHNATIAKENATIDRQREADAAAQSKSVSRAAANEEMGIANALPTRSIKAAKVDLLGDNAVSAAQAPQESTPAPTQSRKKSDSWANKNLAQQHAAISAEKARRSAAVRGPARSPSDQGRVGGAYSGPGSDWGTNADGSHKSSARANGTSRGGVGKDKYGNEVGAYGQQTMDIVGRGDGSRSAGNTRVICTELVRQGRMAPSLQRLDIAFTLRELSPATVRGYHVWAVPYVRLMRRSPLATGLIEPIATWRALEIAHQLGERDQPHYGGKLVRLVMEPACWLIGHAVALLPGDPGRFHPHHRGHLPGTR